MHLIFLGRPYYSSLTCSYKETSKILHDQSLCLGKPEGVFAGDRGEQIVGYHEYYSNVSRGRRKGRIEEGWISHILESEGSSKEYRKNWARLIQKIYEIDPMTLPKCPGRMKIISFIEDEKVIEKTPKYLGLWGLKVRPPHRMKVPSLTISIDDSHFRILFFCPFLLHGSGIPDSGIGFY